MRTLEQKLIDHLAQLSNGLLQVTHTGAKEIINLVTNTVYHPAANTAVANLYSWNSVSSTWIMVRQIPTTDEAIKTNIVEALQQSPSMQFYRWECYNSAGEFEGNIFTINPSLF